MTKVDQIVPEARQGDPITEEAIAVQNFLREDFDSEIFADNLAYGLTTSPTAYIKKRHSDVLIYHHRFDSPILQHVNKLGSKIILRYHAVDPPASFRGFDASSGFQNYEARMNLIESGLLNSAASVIAETIPSALELKSIGCKDPLVMQPPLDLSTTARKTDNVTTQSDAFNVIFVGRMTPAQKVEEVIKVWIHFIHASSKPSELFLYSQDSRCSAYQKWLQRIITDTYPKLVHFVQGSALHPSEQQHVLSDLLVRSHLFLTMSEFEDFCVPVALSMINNIPVIANDCEGIRATLRGSGIVVKDQDPATVAQILGMLAADRQLALTVAGAQTKSVRQNLGNELEVLRKCIQQIT